MSDSEKQILDVAEKMGLCLANSLALVAAIGFEGLSVLKGACRDY